MIDTTTEPKQTTLYYREGSSDKVYHVSLEANGSPDRFLVTFAYGRRGSTLQTGSKTPVAVDYITALKTYNRLVADKLAKGYTPGEDGTPYQHTENAGRSTGIYPQLLTSIEDEHALGNLLLDPLYCAQEKFDGKRFLIRKRGNTVEGINRKGLIVSVPQPIVNAALRLRGDFLLDGEAVDDCLHVFDVLESAGADCRERPYADRLHLLERLIPAASATIQLVYTAWTTKEKISLLERLRQGSREGAVIKCLTSSYAPGKDTSSGNQFKYKFVESASFLVTQTHPSKRSVSLGLYAEGSEIVDAGNVTIPPNQPIPKAGAVVEVRYLYAFRQSGAIYQPCYLGEREDIEPAECTQSQLKYRCEPSVTHTPMNINPIINLPVSELKTAISGFGKILARHSTLPVLGMICIERDRQGWVHLSATDLDTFLTLRLEAPGQSVSPTKFLVPFLELQKLGKSCPADETLELEPVSEEQLILRHRIGNYPVEQAIASLPVADFPSAPLITAAAVSLDEAARSTLLDALNCASRDETRVILNGAYLDVSKPNSHYFVGTDGRHLFASNSIHLPLASSLLIPDHRFLSWSGFIKDGQWKLAVQEPTKDKGGYLKLESRRWTFITKQVEGTYPNWRAITEDVRQVTGSLELSDAAMEAILRIVPRLPGDDSPNHTVGLAVYGRKLFLRGWNKGQERATEVEVPDVVIQGEPATVHVNREYLLKAVGLGLRQISVQQPLEPIRCHDGDSRLLIIMPVRVDGNTPVVSANVPAASSEVKQDQTSTNPINQHHEQPPAEDSNQPPMQTTTTTTNGNAQPPAATVVNETVQAPSLEQALEQIENIKVTIRGTVANLNNLADTLRQVQRERRLNEREIRSVRDTLKSLQTVRL